MVCVCFYSSILLTGFQDASVPYEVEVGIRSFVICRIIDADPKIGSEWGYTTRKVTGKPAKEPKGKKRKRTEGENEEDESDSDSTVDEAPSAQDEPVSNEGASDETTDLEAVLLGRANLRAMTVDADRGGDSHMATLQGAEE